MDTLTLIRPDDWHCHLRDGTSLQHTVPAQALCFERSIVMPNLIPPITHSHMAIAYRKRILKHQPPQGRFEPLMTVFLSKDVDSQDLITAHTEGLIFAAKYYPQSATTHSDQGARSLSELAELLSAMQTHGIPLLIHAESIEKNVDIFDRETRFLETELSWLIHHYPHLKIVVEHISTQAAVEFVLAGPDNLAATITPHHALLNRNDLLLGGIKPHYYCLPILKTKKDQDAVANAATSGHPKFFLGTDSAPHPISQKENACGCAGIYNAPVAMACYADLFAAHNALAHLEAFCSLNGPRFYGLETNSETITLSRKPWTVPLTLPLGDDYVIPLLAGHILSWRLHS